MIDTPTIPAGAVLRIEGTRAYYDRLDGRRIVADYYNGVASNPRFDDLIEQYLQRLKPLPEKWIEISTPTRGEP